MSNLSQNHVLCLFFLFTLSWPFIFPNIFNFCITLSRIAKITLLNTFLQKIMALENAHFSFLQFLVSQFLESFSEKTYEKTCRFHNALWKSSSICTWLRIFMIWIFFSKVSWPFQFNVHFFHFPSLLQENLWKDLPIFMIIFKRSIIMCTFTKFCHREVFLKKMAAVSIF